MTEMKKPTRLVLDLKKSGVGTIQAGGGGQEQRWTRYPGAASMFNSRDAEARETQALMRMPTDKMAISDGNFVSPDDVVKGLGFAPLDETIWAHRVARMVARAPSELALRKAVVGDLRGETLEPLLRAELGRRIVSFFRQRAGGKPLEKGFPPKAGQPPMAGDKQVGGKPQAGPPQQTAKPMRPPQAQPPQQPQAGAQQPQQPTGGQPNQPAVDRAELDSQPDDQQLLRNKIHALHEELKACQGPITGNAALIHMYNDLKAQMRDAYQDPSSESVVDLDHKIHHFAKMLEGPPPPEAPPPPGAAMPTDGQQQPGQPAPAQPGQPMQRTPGKRPPQPGQPPLMKAQSYRPQAATPAMGQAVRGAAREGMSRGMRMKPKNQKVHSGGQKHAGPKGASSGLQVKKPKGVFTGAPTPTPSTPRGTRPPRPFDLARSGNGAGAGDDMEKGANHKYIKRLVTGKQRPKYRYIYDAKKAIDTHAKPKVGEKIKVAQGGQAGHYEVKRVLRDGRVDVQHDETGHRMVIKTAALHDLLAAAHAPVSATHTNDRLDAEHAKVDKLPRSKAAVLAAIEQASGIDDHDLSQADAAYASWKAGGRKGPKPTRNAGKGGELDSFSSDLKRGQKFSSLLEAFEHATKNAKTWRDIAPVIRQLREVPGFENAHLPEDALLRHAQQDDERRTAPDTQQVKPEDFGTTLPNSVDAGGFDWGTGEQHPALATPGQAKAAGKRARAAASPQTAAAQPTAQPATADDEAGDARESGPDDGLFDTSFDFGENAPPQKQAQQDDEWGSDMWRSDVNLVLDLNKADGSFGGGAAASHKYLSRKPKAGGGWEYSYAGEQGAGSNAQAPTAATAATLVRPQPAQPQAQGTAVARQRPNQTPKPPAPASTSEESEHLHGPVSGESPAESVPIANSIIKTGIVGHTTSGKQIKLGMDLDALSPQDAQEASLLHRNAQEQLLNAMRANGNPAYKTAARDHLDAEFDLASRSLQTASDESSDDDDVFASTAKSFGALGDIGAWSPSPMWAGEQLGGLMGLMLSKSIGMERAGHKYIMRKPKAGGVGGYDYTYADEPHSKETLKAAPLGSKLEATHNGATDTYTKTERDSWVGSSGGAISSGWFVGKPSTLTHPGGFEEPAKASPAPEKAPAPKEQPNLFGETPSAKPAPKLQLTAKPVQQGLFGDSAFEGKPAPKKEADPLVNDKRQQGLFVNVDKPKPEEPKTEARRLTVDDARKLGASAHAAGRISASAADPDFNERIKEHNNAFGSLGDQMIPVLTAWNKGWHAANMANDEPAPAKEEPKSAMVEAAKEAEKQPAIASADVDVDAADAANAWKVEPYDEAHEMDREHEAAARDKERIEATRKHLDKTKEEVAAAKGTRKEKQAAEWLKTAEANHAEAVERAARLVEIRAARRAAKKVDVERHMGEASARVKLASDARKRLAAEAEKAKPKKLAETETDTARRNRQREREVGEHIPDSAKDRADERRLLTKGDLDALSFSEAHRLVNKRNAMPVYSLDQFKARGASPGAAHLGLALANLVGPSPPEDSDKSRRAYLDGIRLVHGIMDHANTVEEYDAAVKELNEINAHSFFGGGKPIAVIQTARRLTDEEKAAARAAGRWHSGDYEGIDRLPGNYASEVLTPRVQKENPDLAVGARYGDNGVEFYTYSKSEKSEIQESIKALGKRFNDQLMGGKGKIWSDAHKQARDAEKLGVAGWDHLEKTGEEKASKKTGEKEAREAHESGSGKETKLRWRQSISDKPAVIKPTVNVTHADVNRMNATFGFRAGQPGHSIPNVELAHHHKYAEMAFHDLANVLGIEPKFVSMNGRLGMAFAARGHGKAMAHYEPEKKVINITRYAGAGTIAHEWGHFMDNTVAEIHRASGSTKGRVYGSSGDTGVMPEDLRDAFKAFRTAIATPNPETVRKVQADHDKRFAEAKANVEKLRAHTGRLSYASTPEERADYKAALDSHNGNLDKIATQRKFLANPTSDYMMMSLMHDGGKEGKYWSAPEEMFARAFESYVQEKLESNGRRNSYLVDGARETGDPLNDEMMPYPMKAELPKIHGAIERVVKAMRSGGHFEKAMRLLARPLSARRQAKHVDLFIAL